MIDVKELKENHPEFALLLENDGNRPTHFSKLNYTRIPVQDLQVDSYILVRAGEVCEHNILCMKLLKMTLFCFETRLVYFFHHSLTLSLTHYIGIHHWSLSVTQMTVNLLHRKILMI
jgi:hypothetical protein